MNPLELPLRDIHLPDSVSWWPIASGWWLLLAILFVIAIIIWAVSEIRARKQLRQQALLELDALQQNFHQHQELGRLASDCSILLRRVALSRFNRQQVAGLTGTEWVKFLNQQGEQAHFNAELSDVLTHAPYQNHCDYNAEALLSAARHWLEQLPPQNRGERR